MPTPDPFFDELDAEAEAAADSEGLADIKAGRVVPHEEILAWLKTWGTPDERPAPESWFKSSDPEEPPPILWRSAPTSAEIVRSPR